MKENERTSFKLRVSLNDPEPKPIGMVTMANLHEYEVRFNKDEEDYGNGTYMVITSEKYDPKWIDLRYEPFEEGHEIEWIVKWANNYWSGKDGAWELQFISVERKEWK